STGCKPAFELTNSPGCHDSASSDQHRSADYHHCSSDSPECSHVASPPGSTPCLRQDPSSTGPQCSTDAASTGDDGQDDAVGYARHAGYLRLHLANRSVVLHAIQHRLDLCSDPHGQ